MTVREIVDIIDAKIRLKNSEYKAVNHAIYNLATLIAIGVNNPKQFPKTFSAAFEGNETKGIPVENWRASKAAMEDYAFYHNKKRQVT